MKKLVAVTGLLALVIAGYLIGGSIYKYELYDLAMKVERDRAGLEEHSAKVGNIQVSYLEEVSTDNARANHPSSGIICACLGSILK